MMVQVAGCCPACGKAELAVQSYTDEYPERCLVRCQSPGCPRPMAASEILAETEIAHLLLADEEGWTLKHPLLERVEGRLFFCPVAALVRERGVPARPGVYRVPDAHLETLWTYLGPLEG
jgi:uncharacterized protein DUF6085